VKALFVDTAGWMACADAADPAHEPARASRDAALEAGRLLLTTDYVVDETLTLIRMRLGIAAAEAWWTQIEGSSRLRYETIDALRAEKARSIFFRHRDKDYSFTDCTSFVVMRELRLKEALTTDRHFRQMGFHAVP
jgi:predicted nucleic acid-binding protein